MMITKQRVKKIDGRQFYYFVQSISGDDDLRHQEVNAFGLELAQKAFTGYEVVILPISTPTISTIILWGTALAARTVENCTRTRTT